MTRVKDNEYEIKFRFRMTPNMFTSQLDEMVQKTKSALESHSFVVNEINPQLEYYTSMHCIPYIEATFSTDSGEINTSMCETLLRIHDVIAELLAFKQFRTTEIEIKYTG